MQGHRDLLVWRKAMGFVKDIYIATENFPSKEKYGLTQQLRRAAVSVPSNLAEGHGRTSPREFHQFVGHARGSLLEAETQVEIAVSLGFLSSKLASELLSQTSEIGRMLNGLLDWSERKGRTISSQRARPGS